MDTILLAMMGTKRTSLLFRCKHQTRQGIKDVSLDLNLTYQQYSGDSLNV